MRNRAVFDVPVNYMDSGKRLLRDYIGVTNHRKKGLDLNFETQCVELEHIRCLKARRKLC